MKMLECPRHSAQRSQRVIRSTRLVHREAGGDVEVKEDEGQRADLRREEVITT